MTNDAERVSDIVARLRASVVYYDKAAAMVSNMRKPRTDNDNGLAAGLFEAAADIIEAQSKALAEARWQPIETAPKDGTYVILWDNYEHRVVIAAMFYGYWCQYVSGDVANDCRLPTHWMPLPPPPTPENPNG